MSHEQFRGRMMPPKMVAAATQVTECTVHRWVAAGKITAVKLSEKCTRIDGNSLADFLAASVIKTKTKNPA